MSHGPSGWMALLRRGLRPWPLVGLIAGVALVISGFWPEGRSLLGTLFQVAVVFSAVAAIGMAIAALVPLDRAARKTEAPIQFTLLDFFCLFFLCQMPMALIHGLMPGEGFYLRLLFDGYAWFAFGVMWLASVQRLSRAGITQASRRTLFLIFILPAAVFGMILAPPLSFMSLRTLANHGWREAWVIFAAQAGLLGALAAARPLTTRLVTLPEPLEMTAK